MWRQPPACLAEQSPQSFEFQKIKNVGTRRVEPSRNGQRSRHWRAWLARTAEGDCPRVILAISRFARWLPLIYTSRSL